MQTIKVLELFPAEGEDRGSSDLDGYRDLVLYLHIPERPSLAPSEQVRAGLGLEAAPMSRLRRPPRDPGRAFRVRGRRAYRREQRQRPQPGEAAGQ